jgi:hypothetical protein
MLSVMRELRRRVRAEQSLPTFDPCLPRPTDAPPAGPGWIHEIKHDGFRILAHRRGRSVRLLTRNGNDFADRFPLIADAIEALPVRSCVVDREAIVCDGVAVFDLIHPGPQSFFCLFVFKLQPHATHGIAEQKVRVEGCQPIGRRILLTCIFVHYGLQ